MPIGAEVCRDGGAHFRVWAPNSRRVFVRWSDRGDGVERNPNSFELEPEPGGYFSGYHADARAGMLYKFGLDSGDFPDPASRFQPEGPHGPAQLVDPSTFQWTDHDWRGVSRSGQVIYEMHIGTFTRGGDWKSAAERLPDLAELGITTLEIMPVAEFPGAFGWGYDGVALFAPTRLYGQPDDFRQFVNEAHRLGLAVILDVVYNHIGPDGNYLKEFSSDYFTSRYQNEWGEAINFDGPNSGPVREFFIQNAGYWIDEYHLDGLRLDATQQIFDTSAEHMLVAIGRQVRKMARGRETYIVAENECQNARIVRAPEQGGYGLDGLWNDDLHHSLLVALTGRREAYYSDHRGTPQEIISAVKRGFLFQGQWFSWQKQRRGSPALDLHPEVFVTFAENHDQVANSLRGLRLHQMCSPASWRAATALILLGPGTPMLFQGQEFASSAPFLFFADHNPELSKLVAKGRRKFLEQFDSVACEGAATYLDNPSARETFERCRLNPAERERNQAIREMFRDLLRLRRTDPVFSRPRRDGVDGAVLGPAAFVIRFFAEENGDRLLLINFGIDLCFESIPEPLMAPESGSQWKQVWSSEEPRYGGNGAPCVEEADGRWRIPGQSATVLIADRSNGDAGSQNQSEELARG